jgi:hypothetical protein
MHTGAEETESTSDTPRARGSLRDFCAAVICCASVLGFFLTPVHWRLGAHSRGPPSAAASHQHSCVSSRAYRIAAAANMQINFQDQRWFSLPRGGPIGGKEHWDFIYNNPHVIVERDDANELLGDLGLVYGVGAAGSVFRQCLRVCRDRAPRKQATQLSSGP